MLLVSTLLSISVLTIVYYLGYFSVAIALHVASPHYFLGFGERPCFHFTIRGIRFSIGIFIPVYGLSRVYGVEGRFRKRAPLPWKRNDRPLFTRFLATYGGVVALLIGGWLTLILVNLLTSDQFVSADTVNRFGVYASPEAKEAGFEHGDKLLKINDHDFERYDQLFNPLTYNTENNVFVVRRGDRELVINAAGDTYRAPPYRPFLDVWAPFLVQAVQPDSPAERIGLQPGDQILRVNNKAIVKVYEFQDELDRDEDGKVKLFIRRMIHSDTMYIETDAELNNEKRLGFFINEPLELTVHSNSLVQALKKGTKATTTALKRQVNMTIGWFERERVSGPVTISTALADQPFAVIVLYTLAGMFMSFFFWNLLPYPKSVLWETIALVYETLMRRSLPEKAFRIMLSFSWVILGGIFLWTLVGDIVAIVSDFFRLDLLTI